MGVAPEQELFLLSMRLSDIGYVNYLVRYGGGKWESRRCFADITNDYGRCSPTALLSPDHQRIAGLTSGDKDGTIVLQIENLDGKIVRRCQVADDFGELGHIDSCPIVFSPDGEWSTCPARRAGRMSRLLFNIDNGNEYEVRLRSEGYVGQRNFMGWAVA